MDTWRCIRCGQPACDHIPLRYVWAAWWRHQFLKLVSKPLNKIQDTNPW